ncbi:MAG: type 4a pilus biogenesis protein PilO [Pseudomonadota bacterium]
MAGDLKKQLENLDVENIGNWPPLFKGVLVLLVVITVCGGWFYFDTQHQIDELEKSVRKETDLREQFEFKQKKAANLERYRDQMEEMEKRFGTLLRQLPKSTEVPGLIEDISFAASGSGLDFKDVQMRSEIRGELFTELPLQMEATGTYHQLGDFVSKVSGLPRIVTLHDFTITPADKAKRGAAASLPSERLVLKVTAKTYQYDGGKE